MTEDLEKCNLEIYKILSLMSRMILAQRILQGDLEQKMRELEYLYKKEVE